MADYERLKSGDAVLDFVTYYNYLVILFPSRNSWSMCQKTLVAQASKALFFVMS